MSDAREVAGMVTAGFVDDMPEAEYHADRATLSVSGAKLLLKAPALFRWQQDHPVHKDVFDFGSAAHKRVLGVGAPIVTIEADDWRTAAAKAARDEAREAGAIPLLAKDAARVEEMADVLSSHTLAMRLLSEGRPEVSAYALDEATGVVRRGRMDWLHPNLLVDYKSSVTADPRDLAGRYGVIRKWGYDAQAAWYTDLARDLGHPAMEFCFIFQSKDPPYLVTVARVPDDELNDARARNRHALEIFRDCRATGLWPGFTRDDACATVSLTEQHYEEEVIA